MKIRSKIRIICDYDFNICKNVDSVTKNTKMVKSYELLHILLVFFHEILRIKLNFANKNWPQNSEIFLLSTEPLR